MSEHPIEGLMQTAMKSIQDMVDVNTIVGEPIETSGDIMIIPISKVCFGFAAGGSEFNTETLDEYKKKEKEEEMQYRLPFGGGSGAGVTIHPVAFLVINKDNIKLMPITHKSTLDKIVDYVPDLLEKYVKKDKEDNENKVQNTDILKDGVNIKTDTRKETKEKIKNGDEENKEFGYDEFEESKYLEDE